MLLYMRILTLLIAVATSSLLYAQAAADAPTLEGVWEGKRLFGPEIRGTLDLFQLDSGWRAQIAQFDVPVKAVRDQLSFELPGGRGAFQGTLEKDQSSVRGHWIQPATVNDGKRFASPIALRATAKGRWRGEVVPLDNEFTLYLIVTRRPDGTLGTIVRNPDRNIGVNWRIDHLEREGNKLRLVRLDGSVVLRGHYYDDDHLSFEVEARGGTYDFSRVTDASSNFYARPLKEQYRYKPPVADDDGWPVDSLESVGMTSGPIAGLVAYAEAPVTSLEDPDLHGVLVARHGKLVVEEYFHGFHRRKPHDTRSASKSLTSTLLGAAMYAGAKVGPGTRVYDILRGLAPNEIDPRKKEMTVEHLFNMSSGYDCDDRAYPPRPGNEDLLLDNEDPTLDYYRYTLALPMDSKPGEKVAYCSINPNLLGAVISAATHQTLTELLESLIAQPLQIRRYHLFLQPTGEPYMGGGIKWLPRDFMKLGQVMLNGGTWKGERIVSEEFARAVSVPHVGIKTRSNTYCASGSTPENCLRRYGYLWWHIDFPYKARSVHAYYAGGNGGQSVTVIPELDMVVATYAGNYASGTGLQIQEDLIPRFILPAVMDDSR